MRRALGLFVVVVSVAAAWSARADCAADIDKALVQARALPEGRGRNAVLDQIERARSARHDGDEEGCQEQVDGVLQLLKQSGRQQHQG